jgi:hypothetical protein
MRAIQSVSLFLAAAVKHHNADFVKRDDNSLLAEMFG